MIAVVQRVQSAKVTVEDIVVGQIDRGLCVLASIVREDTDVDLKWMVDKLVSLRIFPQDDKEFDIDVKQIGGGLLLVSNFTVSARTKRGRRPSFEPAMSPALASVMFNQFLELAKATGLPIASGRFGADMIVSVDNDGPITLIVDSKAGE